jgi:hypothetical protein
MDILSTLKGNVGGVKYCGGRRGWGEHGLEDVGKGEVLEAGERREGEVGFFFLSKGRFN